MDSRGKMLVEMSVADMGIISIVLDHITVVKNYPSACQAGDVIALQKKWDEIYTSAHRLMDRGVRSLEGR